MKCMKKFRILLFICLWMTTISNLMAQSDSIHTRYTNLPAIYIETFGKVPITSKTEYVYATMWYVDENDQVTRYDSMQIRGRGNSTWKQMSKKPYRIKFQKKEKFLGKGYAKAKSWTLLANAGDKSLMRNAVTSAMAEFMGMDFCPAYKFVDLNLNGTYLGNYQISDQVEVRAHRVNVREQDYPLSELSDITGGYLMEVDGFKEKNYFNTSRGVPVRIHYPDEEEISDSQNSYIRTYIKDFEQTLFSTNFKDSEKGYRPLVDSTSLAHFVIGTEVSANIDGYWSTYFYKEQQDPRFYWGPLWDYDIAYNNDHRITGTDNKLMTDVGYGETKVWINRMWTDPWFAQLVNRRYAELMEMGMVDHMTATIDSIAELLQESQELNYQKWGINKKMYHEIVLYSSYDQYLVDLKNFINNHTNYLTKAFAGKLPTVPDTPEEPTPAFVPEEYYYRLVNVGTGTLFDVTTDGHVCNWANTSTRYSQDWQIRQIGAYYQLINRQKEMALNDPTQGNVGPTENVGTQLNVASPDTLDDRQLWLLTPQGTNGYYNITNKYTQHTANLNGGRVDNETPIISYKTDDRNAVSNNRQWQLVRSTRLPAADNLQTVEPEEYALAYNPQTQELHFGASIPELLTFQVNIHTLNGQLLHSFQANERCSVAHLPSGGYIVTWQSAGHTRSVKFVKAK